MRNTIATLLLLLAACGDRTPDSAGEGAAAAQPPGADLPGAAGDDAARIQALVDRGMAKEPGARAARYRNLRAGVGGAACGEVALGGAPFRPFVVTPEAIAVIAAEPAIAFEDPSDFAADAWIRWCATPEELAALGPQLKRRAAAQVGAETNLTATAADELPPLVPEGPPAPPAEEAAPKPAAKAPPPQIDSFFNSVQRSE
ncbi:hypothetical protein E2493_12435 [Sphingomonas parva]|uniref:Uncharacterized protein n=1 Tax=Sphingomonas parva TaxID=2555898 RepID=A0A4Y8ZRB4_9SPHN|nr:hypothetical protein [Sphingomonas parva]TFI57997.1 hypothetical protein E2493_12435 [Sphingomonas parva]